jgi:CHASE3 domain sensor protein
LLGGFQEFQRNTASTLSRIEAAQNRCVDAESGRWRIQDAVNVAHAERLSTIEERAKSAIKRMDTHEQTTHQDTLGRQANLALLGTALIGAGVAIGIALISAHVI